MSAVAVRLRGVTKTFGGDPVLDDVDLDLAAGELVALVGRSGTGKTTLLRLLAGFERPDAGTVLVPGRRTLVYQEPRLIPAHRVLRNVLLGQRRTAAAVARARSLLEEVGLGDRAEAWPSTLSGGEAQRVALARALLLRPPLILADEPTASLDDAAAARALDLLQRSAHEGGATLAIATHDARVARALPRAQRLDFDTTRPASQATTADDGA